jgi:hypothetical protein
MKKLKQLTTEERIDYIKGNKALLELLKGDKVKWFGLSLKKKKEVCQAIFGYIGLPVYIKDKHIFLYDKDWEEFGRFDNEETFYCWLPDAISDAFNELQVS